MIELSAIIKRLRSRCPSFQNRVAGTSALAKATAAGEESDLAVPHCFVYSMTEQTKTDPSSFNIGDRTDKRRETFATVVCVDNTVQGAGETTGVMSLKGVDQVAQLEAEIEAAFDGWVPDSRYDGIQFWRGEHIAMDGKRLWHQFEWIVEWLNVPDEQIGIEDEIRALTDGDGIGAGAVKDIHITLRAPKTDATVPSAPEDFTPPPPTPFVDYPAVNQDAGQLLYAGTIEELAQSFMGIGKRLTKVQFNIKKVGSPTGTVVAKLYDHTGTFGTNSKPTGPMLAISDNVDVTKLGTDFKLVDFNFTGTNDFNMVAGTPYCVSIEYTGGNATNCISVGLDTSSPSADGNASSRTGSVWAAGAIDLIFALFAWEPSVETLAAKNAGQDYEYDVDPTPLWDVDPIISPEFDVPEGDFAHGEEQDVTPHPTIIHEDETGFPIEEGP